MAATVTASGSKLAAGVLVTGANARKALFLWRSAATTGGVVPPMGGIVAQVPAFTDPEIL